MNELLGWYGYDNTRDEPTNSRGCTTGSNSSGQESPKITGKSRIGFRII